MGGQGGEEGECVAECAYERVGGGRIAEELEEADEGAVGGGGGAGEEVGEERA